jgi:hypothetical protein
MSRRRIPAACVLLAAPLALLAGCGEPDPQQNGAGNGAQAAPPPPAQPLAPGTTPMAERVAVLGLLNKRTGQSRDLTLRPGQAVRIDDVVVRLEACETTAPWETQQLTGAFVQVDVRNTQGQFGRVFSGWLYRESPSLNVVEHPIYDVWPKSCAMTHPEASESTVQAGSVANSRSSARNSGAGRPRASGEEAPASDAPAPAAPPPAPAPSNAADSN